MKTITGMIPPQAIEIEQSVLGAMMTFPTVLDYALIHLTDKSFYKEANQVIFNTAINLHRAGFSVDLMTVANKLKQENKLECVGGVYYLSCLTNNNVGSFETWVHILKQKHARREAIRIGYELTASGFDDSLDELESFNRIDISHKELSDLLFGNYAVHDFSQIATESVKELQQRMFDLTYGKAIGINTGFAMMNKVLGGWSNGDLVVIAGRPGMGKTALALFHAKIAAQQGKHVYMFSLEMTNTRLVDRIIVGETGICNKKYKSGNITNEEFLEISDWVHNTKLPIHIDEKSFVTVDYIVSNARMRKRKGELDILVIDYLQLMDKIVERNGTTDQAIGLITRKLKSLAKELNIPILLLSQLNRKVEDRPNKRPNLADLRESGNIEQDADIVMFCFRPAYYDIETFTNRSTENLMVIDLAKNRNGQANIDIYVKHNQSLTNFYDDDNDIPTMPF